MSASKEYEIYIPVRVDLKNGKAVSAKADPFEAPYSYAGEGEERYDPETSEWDYPTDKQRATAEQYLDARLDKTPPPERVLIAVDDTGVLHVEYMGNVTIEIRRFRGADPPIAEEYTEVDRSEPVQLEPGRPRGSGWPVATQGWSPA